VLSELSFIFFLLTGLRPGPEFNDRDSARSQGDQEAKEKIKIETLRNQEVLGSNRTQLFLVSPVLIFKFFS
tara:strand:- start:549 stop:761 length:213 start_codon:yes stop_codon:yes gene_type:complete